MRKAKSIIRSHLNNYKGISLNEKIIVIESDDWGAVRTSSNEALN